MNQECSYNELHPLQVLDDSMAPEFPRDCIIVIEPSEVCATGAYVIANLGDERWFRQYVKDAGGKQKLLAVNPGYPEIPLENKNFNIEGVVVQRNIRRKIKHYNPYQPDNGIALR